MRSLLSELARVSHSAQVTGRGGFQGHAGLKNRGARATGHGTPTRSAWPGARLPLGSERALPPGPGARRGHRAGPSPTLEGWRTPRGSVRLEKHTASMRACPATLTERTEPRAPLLPNNHAPHRRNNASLGFSESTSPRVHRRPGREEPAGPRGREGWVAREVRRPAPQAAPSPAFSQCVAGAWPPESWPRPSPAGRVTQAGPAGSAPPSASSAHDFPGPAAIPPGRGAARRLRPRRQPGLGRRGPSHCDAAAPPRPALPPAAAARAATHPHLRAPPDARATACSARGARRGLAASLSARAAPPGAACDTAPAPPPPPLPACRPSSSRRRRRRRLHHATSALSPSLRRSPPSRLHRLWRPRGEAVGEGGPERTAIGVRGGGAEKPSPPSPGQRRRGRGTETARPQAPAAHPWRGPAWCGHFYLRPMAPASRTPSRALPDAPDPPPGFPAALASGRPLKSRLPATSDSSWGLS